MNFRTFLFFVIHCSLSVCALAQQKISGNFPLLAGQQVKLVGFQGFSNYSIDSTIVAQDGRFLMRYAPEEMGMGYLMAEKNKAYFVVLENDGLKLKGEEFGKPETVEILEGNENKLFAQYASEHTRSEQALSAWDYLGGIYKQDPLFTAEVEALEAIEKERERIIAQDNLFLQSLHKDTYISWYLPVRKLTSSVSAIAKRDSKEAKIAIHSFREMDYSDEKLYKSGLLRDVLENHIWLVENSSNTLEMVYSELNISIDSILENLGFDEQKYNLISKFLFNLLEKRSLFTASEYLALKLLNSNTCVINPDFASQLESYRAMKIGNVAPDSKFAGDVLAPGYVKSNTPQKISDIPAAYTVLVFGSSECPACPQELIKMANYYPNWKNNGVEVVFVSLDEDAERFKNFANPFPFISINDYRKWEGPIVRAFHVFATPTFFLLDNKQEILLRPHSAEHINSWIEWYLVQKNK